MQRYDIIFMIILCIFVDLPNQNFNKIMVFQVVVLGIFTMGSISADRQCLLSIADMRSRHAHYALYMLISQVWLSAVSHLAKLNP